MTSNGYNVYLLGSNGAWIFWSHEVCYADAVNEARWQIKHVNNVVDAKVVEA